MSQYMSKHTCAKTSRNINVALTTARFIRRQLSQLRRRLAASAHKKRAASRWACLPTRDLQPRVMVKVNGRSIWRGSITSRILAMMSWSPSESANENKICSVCMHASRQEDGG
jgi:hypothetical protein